MAVSVLDFLRPQATLPLRAAKRAMKNDMASFEVTTLASKQQDDAPCDKTN
jgi:hypothetical protein